MSEDAEGTERGPVMLAATNMLKPPPPVIGSLNKEITLPRTIKLTTLAAIGVGAIGGFLIALPILGASLQALIYGPTLGGALGWVVVSFSPLREESLARWLGLQASSARKRKLAIDGRPVRLYVGIAPLRRTAAGTIRLLPGAMPVDSVSWDERGFPQQEIPRAMRLNAKSGRRRQRLTASPQLSSQVAPPSKRR